MIAYLKQSQRTRGAHVFDPLDSASAQIEYTSIRLHGDCHPGNILWRDAPHFVDFDDARNGPAVQDLWMLLSGNRGGQTLQRARMLEGVHQRFDRKMAGRTCSEARRRLPIIDYE